MAQNGNINWTCLHLVNTTVFTYWSQYNHLRKWTSNSFETYTTASLWFGMGCTIPFCDCLSAMKDSEKAFLLFQHKVLRCEGANCKPPGGNILIMSYNSTSRNLKNTYLFLLGLQRAQLICFQFSNLSGCKGDYLYTVCHYD